MYMALKSVLISYENVLEKSPIAIDFIRLFWS